MTPVAPRRKRPLPPDGDTTPRQTPRTRRRIIRDHMPVTPVSVPSCSRYIPSPRSDALDALAAVACTTSPSTSLSPSPLIPHSPSLHPSAPLTAPAATAAATTHWLARLVQSRPEVAIPTADDDDDDELDEDDDENEQAEKEEAKEGEGEFDDDDLRMVPPPSTTPSLRAVITNPDDWADVVNHARRAMSRISHARGQVAEPERYAREAAAVYYAALDGLLQDEAVRLRGDASKLSDKLIRNRVFHDSIMAFSWECAVAAAGRLDMRMLWMAMHILGLSPFALTKVLEAFVKRFKDMPQPLRLHMMNCDARIVERRLWIPGSELVNVLSERAVKSSVVLNSTIQGNCSGGTDGEEGGKWGEGVQRQNIPSSKDDSGNEGETNQAVVAKVRAKEVVLQMVYKKVLGLASLRAQELLLLLRIDCLAEDVWSCFKACIWQHWHIMVSRHLDQVIMCCIFGVAKVRRVDVKFREIVTMYRTMKHVREPSFTPLLPDVIREVSLMSHAHLTGKKNGNEANSERKEESHKRGDLIQFYNKVFIPNMKKILLQYGGIVKTAPTSTSDSRTSGAKAPTLPGKVGVRLEIVNKSSSGTDKEKIGHAGGVGEGREGGKSKRFTDVIDDDDERRKDTLREAVLRSPMRSLKTNGSVTRIGRVTVGAMSPRDSALLSLRQSPVRRALGHTKVMTPGTRTLYAFGESPGMMSVRSNKYDGNGQGGGVGGAGGAGLPCSGGQQGSAAVGVSTDERKEDVQRQLSFDAKDMKDKAVAANLRRRIAGVFAAGVNGRVRFGSGSAGKEATATQQRRSDEKDEKD